ncbi:hypothetical protein C1Y63_03425 [Corynebacterium sp. 13CS0277]|uniref:endonuclease/exonuclease/phosphatase family protein n=1 Tax=Corynebacterium sp. 13CS0277 TaxID=2071994 RepID=UPI000D038D48|nr:endonuclease/exonuclease/phosphatase family protein [Corynebacterium sp. 13CS0277]PRQ11919.1 hypothetical protein C1Y63_03425 [Corynebacterium sp. 13CS0277]
MTPQRPAPMRPIVQTFARPTRGRMLAGWAGAAVVALWAAAALLAALAPGWGALQALSMRPGVLHALSFPQLWCGLSVVLGIWCAARALLRARQLAPCSGWTTTMWARAALAMVAAVGWWWTWAVSPLDALPRAEAPATPTVTVAAFNTFAELRAEDLAEIFGTQGADVAVLPEWRVDGEYGEHTRALLAEAGLNPENFHLAQSTQPDPSWIWPVSLVWRADGACGDAIVVEPAEQTTFGTVELQATGQCPRILGLHTMAPVGDRQLWQEDLHRISRLAGHNGGTPVVILGDFNATLRHGPLARLEGFADALDAAPLLQRGTWTTRLGALLRTSIDHVLVSDDLAVVDTRVHDPVASDHTIVVTTLSTR